MSLLTFDVNDPSLNHVVSRPTVVRNGAGLFGAYMAGFLCDVFGVTAFIWPLVFVALGVAYVSTSFELHWWRWCGYFLLTLCMLTAGSAWDLGLGDVRGGGIIGRALFTNTSLFFSPGGSALIWFFIILVALQLSFGFSAIALFRKTTSFFKERIIPQNLKHPKMPKLRIPDIPVAKSWNTIKKTFALNAGSSSNIRKLPEIMLGSSQTDTTSYEKTDRNDYEDDIFVPHKKYIDVAVSSATQTPLTVFPPLLEGEEEEQEKENTAKIAAPFEKTSEKVTQAPKGKYSKKKSAQVALPDLDLLTQDENGNSNSRLNQENKERMVEKGRTLMACLGDFDIQGELVHITPGPVVTMFEVRPAPGIRVNRIANLSDDLALGLKALAVRIQAPIPGTDTVGIEIPNEARETVNFRDLLATDDFKKSNMSLPMAIGRDIAGKPLISDLARMPHLLIAGATGAGKSVCLNSILLSFLYKLQPENAKLLLVDPKRIELAVYADLPHLVHPVVTEMPMAKSALDWAVHEMDSRYEQMARLGVRNIAGYNQKLAAYGDNRPQELAEFEPMSFLVIIIDELADLMMTAAREVETSIVRLAQLARAAGIHMILATQRPSVDVVTGLIKANFPCRISFQVTSKHDSRTILDTVGAEHLLGKGDMLFKPSGGKIMRLHGPFVSDEDVSRVVDYWKEHLKPSYKINFAEWSQEQGEGISHNSDGDAAQDPLYADVQNFVSEQGRASISLVQRRFKIGFNRAARLVEQLERDGIIGPADGSKPRTVVR